MMEIMNKQHRRQKPGQKKNYKDSQEELACRKNALEASKSRMLKKIRTIAMKLEKEQIYDPVDTLFLIREKRSKLCRVYGYGDFMDKFLQGIPLTEDRPLLSKLCKTMPVVEKDEPFELLTPAEHDNSFTQGSGKTLSEEPKKLSEDIPLSVNLAMDRITKQGKAYDKKGKKTLNTTRKKKSTKVSRQQKKKGNSQTSDSENNLGLLPSLDTPENKTRSKRNSATLEEDTVSFPHDSEDQLKHTEYTTFIDSKIKRRSNSVRSALQQKHSVLRGDIIKNKELDGNNADDKKFATAVHCQQIVDSPRNFTLLSTQTKNEQSGNVFSNPGNRVTNSGNEVISCRNFMNSSGNVVKKLRKRNLVYVSSMTPDDINRLMEKQRVDMKENPDQESSEIVIKFQLEQEPEDDQFCDSSQTKYRRYEPSDIQPQSSVTQICTTLNSEHDNNAIQNMERQKYILENANSDIIGCVEMTCEQPDDTDQSTDVDFTNNYRLSNMYVTNSGNLSETSQNVLENTVIKIEPYDV